MRPVRAALKFRMELNGYIEVILRDFHGLNDMTVRRSSADNKTGCLHIFSELVIKFISVAMSFMDQSFAVAFLHPGSFHDLAWICTQTERSALCHLFALIWQEVDNFMCSLTVKLSGIRIFPAKNIAGKFNNRHLHPQTDSQIRHVMLPAIPGCDDLSFHTPVSETARNNDSVHIAQDFSDIFFCYRFRVNPLDIYKFTMLIPTVTECFCYGKISIMQLHIFSDDCNLYCFFPVLDPVYHLLPFCHIRLWCINRQFAADNIRKMLCFQHQGCFI